MNGFKVAECERKFLLYLSGYIMVGLLASLGFFLKKREEDWTIHLNVSDASPQVMLFFRPFYIQSALLPIYKCVWPLYINGSS